MNIYDKAIEILNKRGWGRDWGNDEVGPICIMSAVSIAKYGKIERGKIQNGPEYSELMALLRPRVDVSGNTPIYFNDKIAKNKDDVVALLRLASLTKG